MKTEVQMLRPLNGVQVRQKHKSKFIAANDLLEAGNQYRAINGQSVRRLADYFNSQEAQEFAEVVKAKEQIHQIKIAGRGRGAVTWVHPLIALDLALWLSPDLKYEVYRWMHDNLLMFRDSSGDAFKLMNKAIDERFSVGSKYWIYTNTANRIRHECDVTDWSTATEEQLRKRDDMQKAVALLCRTHKYMTLDNMLDAASESTRIGEQR